MTVILSDRTVCGSGRFVGSHGSEVCGRIEKTGGRHNIIPNKKRGIFVIFSNSEFQ